MENGFSPKTTCCVCTYFYKKNPKCIHYNILQLNPLIHLSQFDPFCKSQLKGTLPYIQKKNYMLGHLKKGRKKISGKNIKFLCRVYICNT